jgi:ATP-binding cassette subfamily F protein 3
MITVSSLSIHFTGDDLFSGVSFVVGDTDRIGLTGKNGAGKSTLLKILAGLQEPEKGSIIVTSGHRVGYLPQELTPSSSQSVWDETLTAFKEVHQLESSIKELTAELENRTDYESTTYFNKSPQLSENTERLHLLGAGNINSDGEKVLAGLGFETTDFTRSMTEFSSGWQMRVELAKILLQKPEVMLLDEPTNHLDIESIQWLETFLASYQGAVILVSHDRAFLDAVTTRTIEISLGSIFDYKCSYSEYVEQRLERIEHQQAAQTNQQREIIEMERFVERFRYKATKSKQVQSKIKMLDKMDRIEVDGLDNSSIHFRFQPAPHSGKVIVEAKNIIKSFDQKLVLSDLDFTLLRGQKVAFVGKNGEGKTTFSRIIVGDLLATEGDIKLGHQVVVGYYAQNQAALLDLNKTVFETIDDIAVGDIRTRIRAILGSFLFSGEDIEKKVKVLSGGEKARLALAKLLLTPYNLLILDEPTNHLDMQSKDVLKSALIQYDGAFIIVSHDRDFLQGLTEKVVEFKHHHIKEYIGDVYDFIEDRKIENLGDLDKTNAVKKSSTTTEVSASENKQQWEKKKELESQIRKIKNQISQIEERIQAKEQQLKTMDEMLAQPEKHQEKIASGELYQQYEHVKRAIEHRLAEWELLQEQLMEFE